MDEGRARALSMVDPELVAALEAIPDFDTIGLESLDDFRRIMGGAEIAWGKQDGVETSRVQFSTTSGLEGIIYSPENPVGAILNIHGGGYVMGTAAREDAVMRDLCQSTGAVILSVDYRLAPEFPFPAALDDCLQALVFLKERMAAIGLDPNRVAVRGVSAGGGIATALALTLGTEAKSEIGHLSLLYPMLDDRTQNGDFAGAFVWTSKANAFAWQCYLSGLDRVPILAAPARARDLAGLPSTFIAVGSIDLFAAENIEFAARLVAAGVETELHVFPGAYHGFNLVAGSMPAANVKRLAADAFGRAFRAPHERSEQ